MSVSKPQSHALLNILIHHETYSNIVRLKYPKVIQAFGRPFLIMGGSQGCSSPILYQVFHRLMLPFPGMSSLKPTFWTEELQPLLERFGKAKLSESHDKGIVGLRKTLAIAISAALEKVAHGLINGCPPPDQFPPFPMYDLNALTQFCQQVVYLDLLQEIVLKATESENMEDQSQLVQAALECVILGIASFFHHLLIVSPHGLYLRDTIARFHKFFPYRTINLILQAKRGATIVQNMVKFMLLKPPNCVSSLYNFFSQKDRKDNLFTMSLLQRILHQLLLPGQYQEKVNEIINSSQSEHLDAIDRYIQLEPEVQEGYRQESIKQSKPMTHIIFKHMSSNMKLSEAQYDQAQDYLRLKLSIRDREEITKIICNGDLVTRILRSLITAFEPIIQELHETVSLGAIVTVMHDFVEDLLESTTPSNLPSVEQFAKLLKKHISTLYSFNHQFLSRGSRSTVDAYVVYCREAVGQFQKAGFREETSVITEILNQTFLELSDQEKSSVLHVLSNYIEYISQPNGHALLAWHSRMKAALTTGLRYKDRGNNLISQPPDCSEILKLFKRPFHKALVSGFCN